VGNQPNISMGEEGTWSVISGSGTFDDPMISNTTVRNLASGRNVFRWTIENQGCISYDEVHVSFDLVTADAGESLIITCESELILNANNPGPGTGEWTVRGGSGSAEFENRFSANTRVSNLDRGNNVLRWTITNNKCVTWSEITVRSDRPSNAYAGADEIICTNSVKLNARVPLIGTGSWEVINGSGNFDNDGQADTWVQNVASGANTYRWTIENLGCYSFDEVVIRNSEPANVFAGDDKVLCDDFLMLTAMEPELGTGTWSIIKGGGIIDNINTGNTMVTNLAPDENILRWTVKDGHCTAYDEVRIVNNKPTEAFAGVDKTICIDNTVLEGNIAVQGTGVWSRISGSGEFAEEAQYNSSIDGLARGRNILRWTITKEGCESSDDVIIQNDRPSTPIAGADLAVCDDFTPLNGNMPAIGTGSWSLVSGAGTFEDISRHNTTISNLGQGSNVLRWTINNNSCSLSDQVEIKNNLTDVYAGPDQVLYTDRGVLSGNIPIRGTGQWLLDAGGGDIVSPSLPETQVTNLAQGMNSFMWTVNIDGCISYDIVTLSYFRQASSSFTASPASGCPPLDVVFTKTTTENFPFRWDLGEKGQVSGEENFSYTYDTPGRYIVRLYVTGPDGQEIMTERVITVHEPPVADFELAQHEVFIPGNGLRTYNYSFNGSTYLWDFGDGNTSEEITPDHDYTKPGSYIVSLRTWSEEGCSDSLFSDIPVVVKAVTIVEFPTAFTPNPYGPGGGRYDRGDFSNQVFYPVTVNGTIDNYKFEVFNRWGVLLFTSDDIEIGWDGYYKGQAGCRRCLRLPGERYP
jgi:large repetitive protein